MPAGYEVLPLRNAEQAIVATPEVKGPVRSAEDLTTRVNTNQTWRGAML